MKKFTLLLVGSLILLSGCVEQEILDDLNIETAKGYDMAGEDLIRGTALYPRYSADKQIENVTLTAEAKSTREVLNLLEKKSEQPLVRGSLENVVISEKMAKRGMLHIADSLQRDASVGARVMLLVSDGSAEEILKGNYGNKGTSDYITTLVDHNIRRGDLAKSNLHLFLFTFFQEGHTSYLPIIQQDEDKTLDLTGVALFKNDKMIDRINKEDMFYFKLLADKYSEGNQVVKLSDEGVSLKASIEASVTSLKSKHKIQIEHNASPVKINVIIEIEGIIKEYTGKRLSPDRTKEIQEKMEKDIETRCLKMLKNFQEKGIDPVGFGQRQKHGVRKMDFKKWEEEEYPQAEIDVKANVLILESGTVE
ncbi:Ger(x)C family spore germination protein [Rossellomorea vietnamensis]|uniref:Ger(X)C family spore germination protein n=1 Tax=Rossellomorea vietnamensis TaxID=218284 RepID=A0A5D4NMG2_9BACI|nr:Ger(x)C family spore germination protein [Rossellomorea vietnamensis]TYS14691.1 Ger(x)C family spore germination protein [Rossellomorea vietnamensis]